MTGEALTSLIISIVLIVVVTTVIVLEIVWIKKMRKKYFYRFRSHDIVFEIAARSVRLFVDGKLEDELGGARICMLHATVEDTGIKVHYSIRGFRPIVTVSAGDVPLELMGMGK